MSKNNTWFVTGASKGFGLLLVQQLLENGNRVVATSRNIDAFNELASQFGEQFLPLSVQITDEVDVNLAMKKAIQHFGTIDVLVNNAGYGLFGTMEELSMTEIRDMFDVNVFGVMHVSKAILPHFREKKSGTILNIASIAGSYTAVSLGLYSATKAAVIQFTEALKMEVEEFGIRVSAVCPGGFRTDFLDSSSMQTAQNPIDDYTAVRNTIARYSSLNKMQGGDPDKFPKFIMDLTELEVLPSRIYVGSDALRTIARRLGEISQSVDEHRDMSSSTDFDV
jgi:short-subunit dehydrogenase